MSQSSIGTRHSTSGRLSSQRELAAAVIQVTCAIGPRRTNSTGRLRTRQQRQLQNSIGTVMPTHGRRCDLCGTLPMRSSDQLPRRRDARKAEPCRTRQLHGAARRIAAAAVAGAGATMAVATTMTASSRRPTNLSSQRHQQNHRAKSVRTRALKVACPCAAARLPKNTSESGRCLGKRLMGSFEPPISHAR